MRRVFKVSTRGFTRCRSCAKHIRLGSSLATTVCPFCATPLAADSRAPAAPARGRGGLLAAALLSHGAIACEADSASSGGVADTVAADVVDSDLLPSDDTSVVEDTSVPDDILGDTIALEDTTFEDLWTPDTTITDTATTDTSDEDLWTADVADEDTSGPDVAEQDTADEDVFDICQTVCCECDYGIPPDPNVYAECCNLPEPEENQ